MRIFFCHFFAVVQQQHLQPALAGNTRAEQAGGARANHDHIKFMHKIGL